MNVSLTPELERLVASKVDSGEYNSASEVVRHALPLLSREDQEHQAKLVALRSEIGVGMAEIEGGEAISGPIAVEHARAEFRRLTGRAP
ncbi:MAG TPA: type II toxin-antitoxin system ParD family antitoxin [Longimicrobium sp.]|jgi:antitoxin ParD1/3/4|uniref:type II toxin-antitoxin system ParD family antitoxin n=1 Tax=Longimicrobium sp. TaxID=2029185 RepID=UPI002ED91348